MLKLFLIALFSSIGFAENFYDATWLKTSDVKYFLANSTKKLAKKRLFGGRFASTYTDIVISMCSNVAIKLFVDAQRKKSRIQILSRTQTRSLVYGTTYNVIIQTHECEGASWNDPLYENYTSFLEPDDFEFTGTIDKYGKLTDDWFVYMDLTSPRITKNYKHLFGESMTTSLIQGNILSMSSLNGIIMTTCDTLTAFQDRTLIISSAAKWQVPKIQMVQIDWVDCDNGRDIKSQCFEAKYQQSYLSEDNEENKVIQISIDLDDAKESLNECPIAPDHSDLDLDLDQRRRRRVLLQSTTDEPEETEVTEAEATETEETEVESTEGPEPDVEGEEGGDVEEGGDIEEMAEPDIDDGEGLGSTEGPSADELGATDSPDDIEISASGEGEEGDGETEPDIGMDIAADLEVIDYDSNPFLCAPEDFCYWSQNLVYVCPCGGGVACLDMTAETAPDAATLEAAGVHILETCDLECPIEEVVFLGDVQSQEFVVRTPLNQNGYLGAVCSCNLYECEDVIIAPGAGVGKISLYPVAVVILLGIFFITL